MEMNNLIKAIDTANLPTLVERYFPEARVNASHKMRIYRPWVTTKQEFDASVRQYPDGVWRLHDFVTNQDLNAWGFLIEIVGLPRREAAKMLLRDAGLESDSPSQPTPQRLNPTLSDFPSDLVQNFDPENAEHLNQLATWIADVLKQYKENLEKIAGGVTLDHCIDAFKGFQPRVCACGQRWATKIEMWDTNADGKEFSKLAFGCEPCGELWTPQELEVARMTYLVEQGEKDERTD